MNLKKLKKVFCLALSAFMLFGEAGNVTTLAAETEIAQEQTVEETETATEETTEVTEETTAEEATEVTEEVEETATEEATEEVEETETEEVTEEVEETETEEATEEVEETETEEATEEVEETETEDATEDEDMELVEASIVGTLRDSATYTYSTTGYGNYLVAFTATKNGYVTFNVKGLTQLASYSDVRVMRSTTASYENYLTDTYDVKYGTTTTLPTIGVKAGTTYYLYGYLGYVSGGSTKKVQFTSSFTADENWEKETNDTIGTASAISVNKDYKGTLSESGDDDYYKFTLSEAGYVSVNLKHNALADVTSNFYEVKLLSADGSYTYTYFYSTGAETSKNGIKIGLEKGSYGIKVSSYNWDAGIYTLNVNFKAASNWEKENNGDTNVATKISLNKEYNGTFTTYNDEDYYKFTLDADGYIVINFKHASTGDTNNFGTVYLKDKNGNDITSLKSVGTSKSVSSEKCGLKKGTYYLYLNPAYNCTSTPYTFKVSYTKSDNWEKENNGDVSAATKIDLGKDYNGTTRVNGGYDYDYYKFTLEDKTWVNLSFSHASTGSTDTQWSVYLVDKSGKSISKDANGDYIGGYLSVKGTQTYASMGNIRLAKGTYYIKIYGSSSSEPYKLNVSKAKIKTPKISSVKSASYNSIKVKWKAVAGADQYYVYRSTSKDGSYKKVKTLEAGSTSYTDKKLTTGKKYYYKLKCSGTTNKKTTSGYSEVKGAKPVPATPKVTLASSKKNQMKVSWKQISGATGYEVWRTDKKDGKYSKLTTISKAKTVTYTDKKAKSGKTYYYKVRAYKTVNGKKVYSSYSSVVSKKTK